MKVITPPPLPPLFSIKVAANIFTHHLKQFWHKLVVCYTGFRLQNDFFFTRFI